jgi:hypothetical protein
MRLIAATTKVSFVFDLTPFTSIGSDHQEEFMTQGCFHAYKDGFMPTRVGSCPPGWVHARFGCPDPLGWVQAHRKGSSPLG